MTMTMRRLLIGVITLYSVVLSSGNAAASTKTASTVPKTTEKNCEATNLEDEKDDFVHPLVMKNGNVLEPNEDEYKLANVMGCCQKQPANDDATEELKPRLMGQMPQMTRAQALEILGEAKEAWNGGSGVWPQMKFSQRLLAIQNFIQELQKERDTIISTLMWEIGKNQKDATAEFDRTIQFIQKVMEELKQHLVESSSWKALGAVRAFVRRAAIGIMMILGPYNYPLNETYATLIPALLMGNIVILKIPTVGGLSHLLTMKAFAKALPPGTIHFVSGGGRETMPPLMETGDIDGLAFIGGSKAADDLIQKHPSPHRLKLFLQLEAKNMGIFLPDIFEPQNTNLLDLSVNEAIIGSLSYNGQRCTALKILFVPQQHGMTFVNQFVEKVQDLSMGLPWETHNDGAFSSITPLPNQKRVSYMKQLIDDALSKGAKIMNRNGGEIIGGPDSTLMIPAVLYPVTEECRVYHEEQFGPVIPIVPYQETESLLKYGREGPYGQQVAIFTGMESTGTASALVDKFATIFGKININSQCGRSPDVLPFSGRRSSALGVMSVQESLREFSVPTVVSYKDKADNAKILDQIEKSSSFLEALDDEASIF